LRVLAPEAEPSGGGPLAAALDPLGCLSLFNPAGGIEPPTLGPLGPAPAAGSTPELAQLVERWVRRVAWGGDARRGVARLDIGSGRLAGTELVVVAEPGQVSVELSLPPDHADDGLEARLRRRLEGRGFATEVVIR
jgi:hypothetical protein